MGAFTDAVAAVQSDAAVEQINAKVAGQPEGDTAPEAGAAPAGDLAPDTALENEVPVPTDPDAEPAAEEAAPKEAEPKAADDGTEFGLTPDGKFRLYGKEYEPVELSLMLERLEQMDQAKAEYEKFSEHLDADLPHLKAHPELVHRMVEQGYPPAFQRRAVQMLREAGITVPPKGGAPAAKPAAGEPAAMTQAQQAEAKRLLKMDDLDPELREQLQGAIDYAGTQRVTALAKEVGDIYADAARKFKLDPEMAKQVADRADSDLKVLKSKGYDFVDRRTGDLRADVVRRVYQSAHQSLKSQLDKRVRSVVTAQKKANASVRDNGNGGAVPTRPKEQPKTVRGAVNEWLREIEG